jgi:hypothetical protein
VSTSHERLLAPVAWAFAGACRCESGRRESHRHNSDVVGYVEYSSKTLTGFAQLCWECKRTPLRDAHVAADFDDLLDQMQHLRVLYPLRDFVQ